MKLEQIFFIFWFFTMSSMLSFFVFKGRKVLKQFPKLNKKDFEYFENWVSGYSTASFITQAGGARNVLRIRVTKDELWITSNALMAWIGENFDLIHKISIESLIKVDSDGREVKITFVESGEIKEVILLSRKRNELVRLLNEKMNKVERI